MSYLESRLRKFFKLPHKGETYELRSGLVSQYAGDRKDAIERVIGAMTVGKDVSALFPDVLKNVATHDLEQKKLVYLYLMNYAKTNPELCILAVNTFVQDTEDPNPLVRALAIRTMGCIRVDKIVDYMEIPLHRTLKDDNPYVRKTAAICVAKLFDLSPEMCVEQGFLDALKSMIEDSNPMVVANAVSALLEIEAANRDTKVLVFDAKILKKLLLTLNECTEWGRITLLTALAEYKSTSEAEASSIIDRVSPLLQHENPAVVLAAVKAILMHINAIPQESQDSLVRKLSAPLVSLISTPPEVQYVGLRNIRIILEKYPSILSREMRVFFCKYNDPLYLKLEKIEILVRLVNDSNSTVLLAELREYAMEFDTEFVKRAVRAIGQVAIKLEKISKKAIDVLYDLINSRSEYVINEATIVIQNVLRRYPTQHISTIISIIADINLDQLEDDEALSSYVWIIGEYAKHIPHLEKILDGMVSQFLEFESTVQLALLTTIVKVNLTRPSPNTQKLLQDTLNTATKEVENADVRDKAFLYWRLLSLDGDSAQKAVMLKKLPPLTSTIEKFPPALLNELITEISTLGSVYHQPGYMFAAGDAHTGGKVQTKKLEELQQLAKSEIVNNTVKAENLLDFDDDEGDSNSANADNGASNNNILAELNDLFAGLSTQPQQPSSVSPPPPSSEQSNGASSLFDLMGGFEAGASQNGAANSKKPEEDLLSLF